MKPEHCLMCGVGKIGTDNCPACTWPYSLDGWKNFRIGLRRITIDTGCINAKKQNESLNKLEEWGQSGKLDIQKATPFLVEFKGPSTHHEKAHKIDNHPPLFVIGSSCLGDGSVLAGPDLIKQIQEILFPSVKSLTENQKNDVLHLREHVWTGGHAFVTLNTKDFINSGKKETLRGFGVWVFTPDELVNHLNELYDWK